MTTYILGGGPAGMAVADGLVDAGANPFVLIERGAQLGGLAQTLSWNGAGKHDLGPHKIFSLDRTLIDRIESLLPESDWLTRDKISSIYMKGHFLPYPPSPFALANVFGFATFCRMVAGYGAARVRSLGRATTPSTFEDDLVNRLGKPLYQVLFKPIAEKLWGDPKNLDAKLSKGRVQTPSLGEVLGRLLGLKRGSDFEALTFRYPKGGLSRLWHAIQAKGEGRGKFLLNNTVTGLDTDSGRVRAIRYASADKPERSIDVAADDFVVSTLPLSLNARLLSPPATTALAALADRVITLNDLILVFLHVQQSSLLDESWIFVPDPDIVFHRVSEQESFDPAMTPNGSIVCCEIMSSVNRPLAGNSDEALCEAARQGLQAMGYRGFKVAAQRVIRLPKSYPVFRPGYESGLAELLRELDQFENFRSIGRQGAFNYIGTLDAMDIGYGFANWLASGRQKPWSEERTRTSHYPVLD